MTALDVNGHDEIKRMNWAAHTRTGREFDIRDTLRDMGITAHAPEVLTVNSRGRNRTPERIVKPLLSRLVFIRGTAEDYHRIITTRNMPRTFMAFPDSSWNRYVAPFIAAAAAEYDATDARLKAGEMLQHYTTGQRLEIAKGALAGFVGQFVRTVQRADEIYPSLLCHVEAMGRVTEVRLDPLDVRAAE